MRITVPFLSAVYGIFLTTRMQNICMMWCTVVEMRGEGESMAQTAEVFIGGGIIGASIAYHLRQDGLSGRLLVIERDTTYSRATTPMSMGGVRQQYGVPCNIALARYSLQFYEQFDECMVGAWGRPQAHFYQCGYLFLLTRPSALPSCRNTRSSVRWGWKLSCSHPSRCLSYFHIWASMTLPEPPMDVVTAI